MDGLRAWWNSRTPNGKYIIITIAAGLAVVFVAWLCKSIIALIRRSPTPTPPPLQPIHIEVRTPPAQHVQPRAEVAEEKKAESPAPMPEFPRQPAVPFVERRDKAGHSILSQLVERLAPGNDRLVALWGSGGVGKTRLAIEAVHALREPFAKRIVWVSADGRPDFTLSTLLDGIATQLNRADLRQLAPEPKQEQVCALVAASHALVILDNFETIAHDEGVRCRDFLARRLSCPALITTRDYIASNVVDNISVEEMSDEEARKFLDELVAQAPAHVAFDEQTRERIIKTAAAVPLVMEWVVQQIILTQRPQDVLDKLSRGKSDAARRVFDNSFDLPQVGDDGRAALLALALFTPSASRAALADVAGFGGDVERLERALIPLGSLRLTKTADGGERLTVEGLTRELALAHLSEDSRSDEFRKRFIAYFLQYAVSHEQKTPEDYDALEAERDNLLSAMEAAFAREDWESVIRMAYPMDEMLRVRGYWNECLRVDEIALRAARSSQDESQVAALAHNAAVMYQSRGELEEARRLYEESLEIKKRLGDQQRGVAATLHQQAMLAQDQGELEEARRLYEESLEINNRLGNQEGVASTIGQLGILEKKEGNVAEAVRLLSDALSIFERLGSPNAEMARRQLEGLKGKG